MSVENPSPVALHEAGHAEVVSYIGGTVLRETVIREGGTLGSVRYSLSNLPLRESLFGRMATALAGGLSLERMGIPNPWQGTGSDMAHFNHLADFTSQVFYQGKVTVGTVKSWARDLAHRAIPSTSTLFHHAQLLDQKGTLH